MHKNQRVLRDYRESAFSLLVDAATNGHVGAQHNIAVLYRNGDWVERDDDQALNWYLTAARQGLSKSQVSLGALYYDFSLEQTDAIKRERLLSESSRWLKAAIDDEEAKTIIKLLEESDFSNCTFE